MKSCFVCSIHRGFTYIFAAISRERLFLNIYTTIEIFRGEKNVFGSLLFINRFYVKKLPSERRNMGDEVEYG